MKEEEADDEEKGLAGRSGLHQHGLLPSLKIIKSLSVMWLLERSSPTLGHFKQSSTHRQ